MAVACLAAFQFLAAHRVLHLPRDHLAEVARALVEFGRRHYHFIPLDVVRQRYGIAPPGLADGGKEDPDVAGNADDLVLLLQVSHVAAEHAGVVDHPDLVPLPQRPVDQEESDHVAVIGDHGVAVQLPVVDLGDLDPDLAGGVRRQHRGGRDLARTGGVEIIVEKDGDDEADAGNRPLEPAQLEDDPAARLAPLRLLHPLQFLGGGCLPAQEEGGRKKRHQQRLQIGENVEVLGDLGHEGKAQAGKLHHLQPHQPEQYVGGPLGHEQQR